MPHTYALLFFLIVIASIGTYLIPAGLYDRVTDPNSGRMIVDPATYHVIASTPVHPFSVFITVYKGLVSAADIVFFIMMSYACFYLVLVSGALNAAMGALLRVTKGRDAFILPLFMYLFATAATFFGMFEEAFGFIPIFVGLAIAMGYDALVGLSTVAMGVGLGFASAFMNPFTIGLAQKIAELPLFSGLALRVASWFTFVTMGVIWMMRYAAKVKKDPSKSLMKGVDVGPMALDSKELLESKFTGRNKAVLLVLAIGMGFLIWGVLCRGWYFDELCGLFLATGIGCGIANGYGPSRIAEIFIDAWKDVVFGACVVGVSRGVLLVMQDGQIIDTVIHALAMPLSGLAKWIAAEGMLFVQTLLNFLLPSGSAQAATTIPIMAPLSDILGLPRQVAVLAYQYGDGFSNLLWPTTNLPVMCSLAKVPIERWWKYFIPFFFMLLGAQMVYIFIAVMINYS